MKTIMRFIDGRCVNAMQGRDPQDYSNLLLQATEWAKVNAERRTIRIVEGKVSSESILVNGVVRELTTDEVKQERDAQAAAAKGAKLKALHADLTTLGVVVPPMQ